MNRILFLALLLNLFNFSYAADMAYLEKKTISAGAGNTIGPNDEVEISYTLRVNDQLIETRKNIRLKLDDKKIIPGLYQAIVGSKKGDKISFNVPPELGYGTRVEGASQEKYAHFPSSPVRPSPDIGTTKQAES